MIGPDEYHENVDDNAFTNAMARWNLIHAADLEESGEREAALWRKLAAVLADGYDPTVGRHEQFAGYFALEPLDRRRPSPRRRSRRGARLGACPTRAADQTGRRADAPPARARTRAPGLARTRHRLVRTAHHTRLIPLSTRARGGARRAGRLDGALTYLRKAATLDLEDRNGNSRDGLHVAAMGGVWHALVHGVAGLELHGQNLKLHPHLPTGWDALEFQIVLHGASLRIRVLPDRVTIRASDARSIRLGTRERWVEVGIEGVELEHDAHAWRSTRQSAS